MHIFIYLYVLVLKPVFCKSISVPIFVLRKRKQKSIKRTADEMQSGIEIFMSRRHSQCR